MGGYDQALLLACSAADATVYQFIAPSRPGYLGTKLAVGRTPEEQADVWAGLLDALGLEQAAVIAISGGGQSAIQFALRHSSRCRALVMISACSAQLHVRMPMRFQLMKFMVRLPAISSFLRKKALSNPEAAAERSIPDAALRARTLNDPEAGPLLRALQLSTLDRMVERLPGTENDIAQSRSAFAYPLEQIAAPLLVVHGTDDEAVPVEHAKALASRVPNAELLLLEGGRHTSLFTHLGEIRARTFPFLDAHAKYSSAASSSM
jgi:pimeloyl-ACP methyl ester carboxylesterase